MMKVLRIEEKPVVYASSWSRKLNASIFFTRLFRCYGSNFFVFLFPFSVPLYYSKPAHLCRADGRINCWAGPSHRKKEIPAHPTTAAGLLPLPFISTRSACLACVPACLSTQDSSTYIVNEVKWTVLQNDISIGFASCLAYGSRCSCIYRSIEIHDCLDLSDIW